MDLQNKSSLRLFIGSLSYETTEETLTRYFLQSFGVQLSSSIINKNSANGKSRGFGFITFYDEQSRDIVLQNCPHYIDGRKTDIKEVLPKGNPHHCHKVFVGGLSRNTTERHLEEYFSAWGGKGYLVSTSCVTSTSRNFGFVTFHNEEYLNQVLQYKHTINGKPVDIRRADPKVKTNHKPINPMLAYNSSSSYGSSSQGSYSDSRSMSSYEDTHSHSHSHGSHHSHASYPPRDDGYGSMYGAPPRNYNYDRARPDEYMPTELPVQKGWSEGYNQSGPNYHNNPVPLSSPVYSLFSQQYEQSNGQNNHGHGTSPGDGSNLTNYDEMARLSQMLEMPQTVNLDMPFFRKENNLPPNMSPHMPPNMPSNMPSNMPPNMHMPPNNMPPNMHMPPNNIPSHMQPNMNGHYGNQYYENPNLHNGYHHRGPINSNIDPGRHNPTTTSEAFRPIGMNGRPGPMMGMPMHHAPSHMHHPSAHHSHSSNYNKPPAPSVPPVPAPVSLPKPQSQIPHHQSGFSLESLEVLENKQHGVMQSRHYNMKVEPLGLSSLETIHTMSYSSIGPNEGLMDVSQPPNHRDFNQNTLALTNGSSSNSSNGYYNGNGYPSSNGNTASSNGQNGYTNPNYATPVDYYNRNRSSSGGSRDGNYATSLYGNSPQTPNTSPPKNMNGNGFSASNGFNTNPNFSAINNGLPAMDYPQGIPALQLQSISPSSLAQQSSLPSTGSPPPTTSNSVPSSPPSASIASSVPQQSSPQSIPTPKSASTSSMGSLDKSESLEEDAYENDLIAQSFGSLSLNENEQEPRSREHREQLRMERDQRLGVDPPRPDMRDQQRDPRYQPQREDTQQRYQDTQQRGYARDELPPHMNPQQQPQRYPRNGDDMYNARGPHPQLEDQRFNPSRNDDAYVRNQSNHSISSPSITLKTLESFYPYSADPSNSFYESQSQRS